MTPTLPGAGPRMGFVGVSTAASSIMRIFPAWARELGLPTDRLVGHDVSLDAQPPTYRDLVSAMQADPSYLGALVTSHKISVYNAAHEIFDEIDHFGRLCGEISSISKRDGRLLGHAKDPITADLSMREFLPEGYFVDGAEVLCLGSGGAATAITWCLARLTDPPAQIVCTDVDDRRLAHLKSVHREGGLDLQRLTYVHVSGPADELLQAATPGSLVINATGLGKDRPGSPVTDDAAFPEQAIFWELNYRGTLEMLATARAQEAARRLTLVDGWRYFIHGWTQVISEVFDIEMTPAVVERLSLIAADIT